MNELLAASAAFFYGADDGEHIAHELVSGGITLPGADVLRDAKVRLECIDLLWERQQMDHYDYWRYLNPDGSPQLGWLWLALREDRVAFPKMDFPHEDLQASADVDKL